MRKSLIVVSVLLQLARGTHAQSNNQPPPPEVVSTAEASFGEYSFGADIDYILSTVIDSRRDIPLTGTFDPTPGVSLPPPRPAYPNDHIASMVFHSDFVGTATTLSSWTYPTSENRFATTIYLVRVDSVALNDRGAVKAGQEVYITRAGGAFDYKGYHITADDPEFPLFTPGKHTYYLVKKSAQVCTKSIPMKLYG